MPHLLFRIRSFALVLLAASLGGSDSASAQDLLIPMDEAQSDHLRAYGAVYWALADGLGVDWLLNYRGGAFLAPDEHPHGPHGVSLYHTALEVQSLITRETRPVRSPSNEHCWGAHSRVRGGVWGGSGERNFRTMLPSPPLA